MLKILIHCRCILLAVNLLNGILNSLATNEHTNFVLKRFEHCNPRVNYIGKFNMTFKSIQNKQYVDGTMTLDAPLDNTLPFNFSVEMMVGKNYIHLFSFNDRKACDAIHKYMGEFVYDLERSAQLIPKMCPILKGRYHLHNAPLNFEKITLQTFPFGNLRLTDVTYTHGRKTIFFCLEIEVENRIQ